MTKVLVAALALAFAGQAFAQEVKKPEGQTTMKVEEAADKKNKVDGDVDQEITNARMRAESGSKSKFSLSTVLRYTGGPVVKPFGEDRPDLSQDPGSGNQVETSADIALDGRYRWSKNDSVTLGTSFGLMTPFQGDTNPKENQLNVFDPGIGYSRVGKVGAFQTSAGVSGSLGTSKESQSVERDGRFGASVSALYAFQNRLTLGSAVQVTYSVFGNDPGDQTDRGTGGPRNRNFYGGDRRSDYTLNIFPFAEYTLNDTFSLRTVFGYFNWRHLYGDDKTTRLLQTYVYQSLGVAISVSRDIYLYPNVQFVPDNIRDDFTNVALSATMNVF